MRKNISFKTYRLIDLLILTGLLVIFEMVASQAPSWFSEKYYISLLFSMSLIVLMRWNAWSIITILAGTVVYCLQNQGDLKNYIIYMVGNLFILFNLLWFIKGKHLFKKSHVVLFYITSGYLFVEIGRSLVALFFDAPFFSTLIGFLGTDLLNFLLALLIVFIMRRQDGLFEDQIAYLKRMSERNEKDESSLGVNENETYH
jgi:hypothetical protein